MAAQTAQRSSTGPVLSDSHIPSPEPYTAEKRLRYCDIVSALLQNFAGLPPPPTFAIPGQSSFATIIHDDKCSRSSLHRRKPLSWTTVQTGAIIVSDIDMFGVGILGAEFSVDPLFFAQHVSRRHLSAHPALFAREARPDTLDLYRGGPKRVADLAEGFSVRDLARNYWHIENPGEGLFRPLLAEDVDSQYRGHDACISFYQLKPDLYLILVDERQGCRHLWYNWHGQSGCAFGHFMERTLEDILQPTLYNLVCTFFTEPWNRGILALIANGPGEIKRSSPFESIEDPGAVHALCWLLSIASLRHTLDLVTSDVHATEARALRNPGSASLTGLNSTRRCLHQIRNKIGRREEHMSSRIDQYTSEAHEKISATFRENHTYMPPIYSKTWVEQYATLRLRSDQLMVSLNDSVQLLIGVMTVQDSDTNKKQAKRATMLTLLAAIYLPLTLATGIFGMNIKEINDGTPLWWAVVVAVTLLSIPSIIFVVYLFNEERLEAFWKRLFGKKSAVKDVEKMA